MELKELNTALETLGRDWEQYKKTNDARLDAVAKSNGTAELQEKLEKIDSSVTALVRMKETFEIEKVENEKRIGELEAAIDRVGPAAMPGVTKSMQEYKAAFVEWIRTSREAADNNSAKGQQLRSLESKDVTIGTGSQGGFAVPEIIAQMINDQAQLYSPIRQDCHAVQVGSSDYKELLDIYGETSGWVGETAARTGTTQPSLVERAPTFGTVYCRPQATEEAMMDIFFNVEKWLVDHCSWEIARQEGIAAITGNGTNKPTGFLNSAPVTTGDASGVRAAGVLQYIPLMLSTAFDPDSPATLVYGLRAQYRANAVFAMNSLTCGAVRKLKDTQGAYHWSPGLANGQPSTLMGYPVRFYEDMADIAANTFPILFGDLKRGYMLVDRQGLRISVDDNLTTPGYVKYYVRRRVGGCILDANALKVGKWATT